MILEAPALPFAKWPPCPSCHPSGWSGAVWACSCRISIVAMARRSRSTRYFPGTAGSSIDRISASLRLDSERAGQDLRTAVDRHRARHLLDADGGTCVAGVPTGRADRRRRGPAGLRPLGIAILGVVWPPVVHGRRSFPAMVWLGVVALLVLVPSVVGLVVQLRALGSQTLLPSLEAAYPWLLALAATSLFTGFGLARRILGQTAMRRRRLVRGILVAAGLTAVTSVLLGGAAVANDIALRDRSQVASRFGPTDPGCPARTVHRRTVRGTRRRADHAPVGRRRSPAARLGRGGGPSIRQRLPLARVRRHRSRARQPWSRGGRRKSWVFGRTAAGATRTRPTQANTRSISGWPTPS